LTPGETVIPKQMTERLNRAAEGGDSRPHVTVKHYGTYNVQAFDSAGVDKVLQQHGDKFTKHAEHALRKMNR
jgi:hypothetical protein